MIYVLGGLALLALIFLPQVWVRNVIERHGKPRDDFPGTGSELARHLLDDAGLQSVNLELTKGGDHYDPQAKAVRFLFNLRMGLSEAPRRRCLKTRIKKIKLPRLLILTQMVIST